MAKKVSFSSSPTRKPLPKKWWIILGVSFLVLIIGIWYWTELNTNKWMHVPKVGIRLPLRYEIHGIDISHHNNDINWQKLRQMKFENLRLQFVFIKATEGMSISDEDFTKNWKEADAVGLYRGAYHFYIPWKDPKIQAQRFINAVKLQKGDLPPVLDFEKGTSAYSKEQVIINLRTWLQIIENHYGIKPIIYTNSDFYKRYVKDNFDEYPLWIAEYSNWELNRYDHAEVLFWQHSQAGFVEGIGGEVDYNVFLGSADDLKGLCVK